MLLNLSFLSPMSNEGLKMKDFGPWTLDLGH